MTEFPSFLVNFLCVSPKRSETFKKTDERGSFSDGHVCLILVLFSFSHLLSGSRG